ncbi:hypothetical protein STCU_12372 [Strigomonas culicis]|uniref:Uncharacterized protein n=1 Tax=Strigomonas culicis TaxID=28005 RepID=S9TDM0_9TRYP|nr:hypothetical protein STCU_12372 [Strigomonas culicis]|eukprot:EPY15054.1 hypothetical protein STCU_12372 [Strigomonas culicis]
MALECVQQMLSRQGIPLPPQELLLAYMHPIIQMISGLCKRGNMSCAVVQIGVTLIADVVKRYDTGTEARAKPSEGGKGAGTVGVSVRSGIPFPIVVCARVVIEAITSKPPKPLPAALIVHQKNLHHIQCDVTTFPATANTCVPCRGIFYEEHRDEDGVKSFEVEITSSRKGVVKVGWCLRDEHNQVVSGGDQQASPVSGSVPAPLLLLPLPPPRLLVQVPRTFLPPPLRQSRLVDTISTL